MKEGDKVKIIGDRFHDSNGSRINEKGRICTIYRLCCDSYKDNGYIGRLYELRNEDGQQTYAFEDDLQVINNNMSVNIKEKFTLAFKKEPEKSFRKTGITNGDDFLTEDGQLIFLGWLLKKHGEEFKKDVVDDLLKDQEEDKATK